MGARRPPVAMPLDEFRTPVTLRGRYVELVPLEPAHRDELHRAARDPEIGRFLRDPPGTSAASVAALIALVLGHQRDGSALAFATRRLPDGPVLGMTRYLNIDRPNRNVEIGGTWIDSAYWRTPVNTESKLLLLRHAFEEEQVRRVQLQTDLRNVRSQRAIERLGAVREAALRENVLLRDGYYRTSVIYSVLASEWPAVRVRLASALERPWSERPPVDSESRR